MSISEERQLLRRLQSYGSAVSSDPTANRLKRKLIVRQVKRERGLPVFDLDLEVSRMLQARGLIAAREDAKKQVEYTWFPLGLKNMENLEKREGIFQSGKSQQILIRLEKSENFTQNTGKIRYLIN